MWVVSIVEQVPLPVRHDGSGAYLHMHQGTETALESGAHRFSHVIANDLQHIFWERRQVAVVLLVKLVLSFVRCL